MLGCGSLGGGADDIDGPVSQSRADRYIHKAIRSSSEGVILLPSARAQRLYRVEQLNTVAQELRRPAAACFVNRAIETMKLVEQEDGRADFVDVPEGQVKIRTRLAPDGEVLRTGILESGFTDDEVVTCLQAAIEDRNWPRNASGNSHYIDVVYWVSLGAQSSTQTEQARKRLRKEQVTAGMRAKQCLRGRVKPGEYHVEGLNLLDRDGHTLTNRIEPSGLPSTITGCLAAAFRKIRMSRDPNAFIRPVTPVVEFRVDTDGAITVADEEWYALIVQEERARREAKRAEIAGGIDAAAQDEQQMPQRLTDETGQTSPPSQPATAARAEPPQPPATPDGDASSAAEKPPAVEDDDRRGESARSPAQRGLKLDLRGHRDE